MEKAFILSCMALTAADSPVVSLRYMVQESAAEPDPESTRGAKKQGKAGGKKPQKAGTGKKKYSLSSVAVKIIQELDLPKGMFTFKHL